MIRHILLVFACCVSVLFTPHIVSAQSQVPQTAASAKPQSSERPSASPSPDSSAPNSPVMGGSTGIFLKPDPKPSAKNVADLKPEPRPSSLASSFLGADDWSQYTLSGPRPAFIDGDQRMSLPVAEPTIELARLFNGLARTIVAFTLWLTDQVVTFGLAHHIIPIAIALGSGLQTDVIGPIRLGDIALIVAIGVIAYRILTGQQAHGMRDMLIGIGVIGLAAIGMAAPSGPICASLSVVGGLSRYFLAIASGEGNTALVDICTAPSVTTASVVAPIKAGLFTAFVQEPFMALQWGQLSEQCRTLAQDIVNAGYFGDSPEPRHVMTSHGCTQAAAFNGSAGIDRAVFAALHLIVVAGWSLGMIVLLAPLVSAQGVGAVLILSAPIVWTIGVVPSFGHRLLGTWVYTGFKAASAMVLSGALLALVLKFSTIITPTDQRLVAIALPTMVVIGLAGLKWKQRKGV
ncbi:hypothetical protein [Stomatohabitans albus]|uniref:hypothetical protein n=1 Tax=Stomatohabitans albus TaxID=3110766 RepID=UPI00300C95C2